MNNIISTDISEKKEDSEATSENFVKNLEIENVKNELKNEY